MSVINLVIVDKLKLLELFDVVVVITWIYSRRIRSCEKIYSMRYFVGWDAYLEDEGNM